MLAAPVAPPWRVGGRGRGEGEGEHRLAEQVAACATFLIVRRITFGGIRHSAFGSDRSRP
jgi:hypothetical protein